MFTIPMDKKLLTGTFCKRYKRFFADVELEGQTVVAHVPNTGSLKSVVDIMDRPLCRVSAADNPDRKLKFTLEQIQVQNTWVGVNTQRANAIGWEIWLSKTHPDWKTSEFAKSEVKISKETRFDMVICENETIFHRWLEKDALSKQDKAKIRFVEIKNVTLKIGQDAAFPDGVTSRGQKHLRELTQLKNDGFSAEILFVIQRNDVTGFRAAHEIDPAYANELSIATAAGVTQNAVVVQSTEDQMKIKFL
jgi:sugar fermentation stimulation protein A